MKAIIAVLLVVMTALPTFAVMSDDQKTIEKNVVLSFLLGENYILGKENASLAAEYNNQISLHNTQLNQTYGAKEAKIYLLPLITINTNEPGRDGIDPRYPISPKSNGGDPWKPPYLKVFDPQMSEIIEPKDKVLK